MFRETPLFLREEEAECGNSLSKNREEMGMGKSQDAKKSEKKKPLKTAKEKKQAKQEKKRG
jgi:hypothetical protein